MAQTFLLIPSPDWYDVAISYAYDPSIIETTKGVASAGFILVTALLVLVVQFVDVAIVLGRVTVREPFRVTWQVVVSEPVSVVGYSVLRFSLSSVPMATWLIVLVSTLPQITTNPVQSFLVPGAWTIGTGMITIPLTWSLVYVHHVTYFHRFNDRNGFIDKST